MMITLKQLRQKYDREYKIGPAKLAPLYLTEEVWMSDETRLPQIGEEWILRDNGSPWPSTVSPTVAIIRDVKNGWVRLTETQGASKRESHLLLATFTRIFGLPEDRAQPPTTSALRDRTILSLHRYVHQWRSEGHGRITVEVDTLIALLDIAISHRGIST